jgi:hypothetical protein
LGAPKGISYQARLQQFTEFFSLFLDGYGHFAWTQVTKKRGTDVVKSEKIRPETKNAYDEQFAI